MAEDLKEPTLRFYDAIDVENFTKKSYWRGFTIGSCLTLAILILIRLYVS